MSKKIRTVLIFGVIIALFSLLIVNYIPYIGMTDGVDIVEMAGSSFKRFKPSEEYVKPLGRTHFGDSLRYLSMSGSGIEFLCKGSYAYITVIGDNVDAQHENQYSRFAIYKNGELVVDDTVNYEKRKYHIEINDFENGAVVKLVKLSEAACSGFYVGTIGAFCSGDIEPTAKKETTIEFIGDSITCGYGIDDDQYGYFSTSTENFSRTYAYLTAKELDADYSAVAFSGYGVLSGYTSDGRINSADTLWNYYDKSSVFSDGSKAYWDFGKFNPDCIVINLGTNDASYCATGQRREAFYESYYDFIKFVRNKNPDSYILCVLGDMNNSLYPMIEKAVSDYRINSADYRVEAMMIEFKMGENPVAVNGHPGAESNVIAAEMLIRKIKEIRINELL